MKILLDCFSCSPYYGSDEGIGWLWPYCLRKYHEVWVLVRSDRKPDIEKYCTINKIKDIHFIYADLPNWLNFYYHNLKKGKNGTLDFLFYQFLWQFPAYTAAKRIHKIVKFDLIHHVGTNDFRLLGLLYKINVPFVIGPIGGAQETVKALTHYTIRYKRREQLRKMLNRFFTAMPTYRCALNRASRIFVSNAETRDFLLPLLRDKEKCSIMTEIGILEVKEKIRKFAAPSQQHPFVFMWAGRMEYRKGLEFLFDVLCQLPEDLNWRLILCGDGSEFERYRNYVKGLPNVNEKIEFKGKVPYEELTEYYNIADVFVFPSLRETTGTVIVEAMSSGLPVIALKQGGAVEVIAEGTGILVTGETREEYIENFAAAMKKCVEDPKYVKEMSVQAQKRIEEYYTWQKKVEKMVEVYSEIVGN